MMNHSTYHPQSKVASVEPGARWKNVYRDLLDNSNVMVTGGRDGGVGVGGYTLGGGVSYYTGLNGFACDTVVNYEVVLANGSVINANATSHPLLWKSLKGGLFNFGIVTRFDLQTMPAQDLSYGQHVIEGKHSDAVLQAFVHFTDASEDQPEDHMFIQYTHDTSIGPGLIIVAVVVDVRGNLKTNAFDNIKTIPNITSKTELMSLADAANSSQLAAGTK
jgi:FAD/FMN-containing dehydrogenase